MALISEQIANEIRERLSAMAAPVEIVHFTQELNLQYGHETRGALEELSALSDKLSLQIYDFVLNQEKVAEFGVDKVPATVIRTDKDFGIRFYGFPGGYEFSALLDAIVDVSNGRTGLTAESKKELGRVNQPIHLEVFVTPT